MEERVTAGVEQGRDKDPLPSKKTERKVGAVSSWQEMCGGDGTKMPVPTLAVGYMTPAASQVAQNHNVGSATKAEAVKEPAANKATKVGTNDARMVL